MKKTLFLTVALGLATWCPPIHAEERTWTEVVWDEASDVKDRSLEKDTKLIIKLGNSEEAYLTARGTVDFFRLMSPANRLFNEGCL